MSAFPALRHNSRMKYEVSWGYWSHWLALSSHFPFAVAAVNPCSLSRLLFSNLSSSQLQFILGQAMTFSSFSRLLHGLLVWRLAEATNNAGGGVTQTDFTGSLVLEGWHIAVIVCAIVVVLAVIAGVCYWKVCRKTEEEEREGRPANSHTSRAPGTTKTLRFGTSVGKVNHHQHR